MTRELPSPFVPSALDELTPAWLSSVLRDRSVIRETSVARVRCEPLGAGEGFVGNLARLDLDLDRPEPGAPASVVAKLPTALEPNRSLGEMTGAYDHEIRFYEELTEGLGIQTPRCYFSAMDPNPLAGREERLVRFLEALPAWLVRWLQPFFHWIGRRQQRRYVLLLEDLSGLRVGDQVGGCSDADLEGALRALAAGHASRWQDERLAELGWLPGILSLPRYLHALYAGRRREFESAHAVPEGLRPAIEWLGSHGVALQRRLGEAPVTLLHGDYRLDNLFFHDGDGRVIAADWQAVCKGPAAYDLAYFLLGTLSPETAPPRERALLGLYHATLAGRGVGDYALADLEADYARAKLLVFYRFVVGIDLIDLASEERGARLLERMTERLFARVPRSGFGALLA